MSTVASSIGSNSRLRIARLVRLLVVRQRLAALDAFREHLPVDHPYRRMLDTTADEAFTLMVCGCPDVCACGPRAVAVVVEAGKARLLAELAAVPVCHGCKRVSCICRAQLPAAAVPLCPICRLIAEACTCKGGAA